MALTPFVLPRSRLEGGISNRLQLYLPDQPNMRVLDVDFPLTYAIAKRYGFDPAASVRYAFDLIKSGAIDKAQKKKAKKADR